jgi:hypothetical protein
LKVKDGVVGGFIVGFDHDHEDVSRRQTEFIHGSAIPVAMAGLLNAYLMPGFGAG